MKFERPITIHVKRIANAALSTIFLIKDNSPKTKTRTPRVKANKNVNWIQRFLNIFERKEIMSCQKSLTIGDFFATDPVTGKVTKN